ncbi:MAG: MarR family transcriptional regulator [Chloroflexi bacterium]|nr:MarR family transcriptional regulator [Chloroflexota bacterium]
MKDEMQGEELQAQIGKLQENIMSVVHMMYRGIEEELAEDRLAVGVYSVLAACFVNAPITVSDIQKHVPLDTGRISRIVSNLEERNFVRKTRRRDDRRMVSIEMTDEGRGIAAQLMGKVDSFYVKTMSRITDDELTYLIAFIEQMLANAERARQQLNEEGARE